ncbi:DUF305 domain-containing protein [Microseira sp. BLCC-F43]|uniref:DUF305 domain-containing protein n=1 Tax=Microseira sp. BLCC-F43 TaxID=3153602 RepID=UPI0035B76FCB
MGKSGERQPIDFLNEVETLSKKVIIYTGMSLLTSSAITGVVLANGTQAQSANSRQNLHQQLAQVTPRPRGMMAQADRHFIEMMIPHHQGAIDMADLALRRAKHPEIRRLAQIIKRDQTREIQQMRTWYKAWYGTQVPATSMGGMGMMGMHRHGDMMGDLEALRNASDFDQEFIRQMIPHHEMALRMSSMALNHATKPEIRNLANSIIKSQTDEINQMRQFYLAWYRRSPD